MNIELKSVLFSDHIQIGSAVRRLFNEEEGYKLSFSTKHGVVVVIPGNGVPRMVPVSSVSWMEPKDFSKFDDVEILAELSVDSPPEKDGEVVIFPPAPRKPGRPRKS